MDNKNYSKILKLIIYVYIFIMIFISFLLMFNNIINIIFYSYYKYNDKFILNDKENYMFMKPIHINYLLVC